MIKIGRYHVLSKLASGGMASIYLARLSGSAGFEKTVALKKIHSTWSRDPGFVEMLIDEAKILVQLHHRNIVQIFELGCADGNYFIVMEYVLGADLRQTLTALNAAGHKLSLAISLHIAREVLAGLEFAHTRKDRQGNPLNIVHRDISPQNILLSREGDVKIADFGIAKVMGKTSRTTTGMLKGKFAYMSPEQACGRELDPTTDLFALAAVLYEMTTGRKCFAGQNDLDTLERVRHAHIDSWSDIPPALLPILRRSLSADLTERYRNACEMDAALAKIEKEIGTRCDARDLKMFLATTLDNQMAEPDSVLPSLPHDAEKPTRALAIPPAQVAAPDNFHSAMTVLEHPTETGPVQTLPDTVSYQEPIKSQATARKQPNWRLLGTVAGALGLLLLLLMMMKPIREVQLASAPHPHLEMTETAVIPPSTTTPPSRSPLQDLTSHIQNAPRSPAITITAPPAAKSTPQPAPTYGLVKVQTLPWGLVSVGGQHREGANVKFNRIKTGMQTITVSHPPSKKRISRRINVSATKTAQCQADLSGVPTMTCR